MNSGLYKPKMDQIVRPQQQSILEAQKQYDYEQNQLRYNCLVDYKINPIIEERTFIATVPQAPTTGLYASNAFKYPDPRQPKYFDKKPSLLEIRNKGWYGFKMSLDNQY